jgi:hypothetical protein
MKQRLFTFFFIALILLLVVGCAPGSTVEFNTSPPNNTPLPNGQVKVAGSIVQLYAPGPNPSVNTADANDRVSGVFAGIWHGIISPVTLVMSFINPDVQMYEVHNNGSQYNLGFLIGVAVVFVLLGTLIGSRRR